MLTQCPLRVHQQVTPFPGLGIGDTFIRGNAGLDLSRKGVGRARVLLLLVPVVSDSILMPQWRVGWHIRVFRLESTLRHCWPSPMLTLNMCCYFIFTGVLFFGTGD